MTVIFNRYLFRYCLNNSKWRSSASVRYNSTKIKEIIQKNKDKKEIKDILILSNGVYGEEIRSIALAKALEVQYKVINLKGISTFEYFPSIFKKWTVDLFKNNKTEAIDKVPFYLKSKNKLDIRAPYPSLIISSGKETILASLYLRSIIKKGSFFAHIGYPGIPFNNFDSVLLMKHELLKLAHLGPVLSQQKNMIVTPVALNTISSDILRTQPSLEKLLGSKFHLNESNSPTIAFLFGYIPMNFMFLNSHVLEIANSIKLLATRFKAKIIISHSERSPKFIKDQLYPVIKSLQNENYPIYWYSSGGSNTSENNPYLAILKNATHFVIPAGCVNLISEVLATKKPLYITHISQCRKELATFTQRLKNDRLARPFHVSKRYVPPGDPLSFLGEHPPFKTLDVDVNQLAASKLRDLIDERK